MSAVLPFKHDEDCWDVIFTPVSEHGQGRCPVEIVYKVKGYKANRLKKDSETPSLTAPKLLVVMMGWLPEQSCRVPSFRNKNSHTIVAAAESVRLDRHD
jgi:hypothetical protein